jgi:hypothetical protein
VNEKHVPTASLGDLVVRKPLSGRGLSVSALAVLSVVAGATVYALIPVLLAWRGTDWVVIAAARKGPIGRNGGARE